MANTQTKRRPRKPGRPKVKKQPELDGRRLRKALDEFKFGDKEVAVRTGIPQFTLHQIMSGKRSLGREDLRSLAKIGIPADYILGASNELIPIGETRTQAILERDVANRVARLVGQRMAEARGGGPKYWGAYFNQLQVDGGAVMALAVDREYQRFNEAVRGLEEFVEAASQELAEHLDIQLGGVVTDQRIRRGLLTRIRNVYMKAEFRRRIQEEGSALRYLDAPNEETSVEGGT